MKVKISLSEGALDELCTSANKEGYVKDKKRRMWAGKIYEEPWRMKGLGLWIEERIRGRALRDMRGIREEEIRLLREGKLIKWGDLFGEKRQVRQYIEVSGETLKWAQEEGMRWGMFPKIKSGNAYLGMLLEAIGSGYLELEEK